MTQEKPRWLYRFDNFVRAYALLRDARQERTTRSFSMLEKEGVIHRFKHTWELSWKVMKDYLVESGIDLVTVTPASVFRAAFAAQIIEDGEGWMDTIEARNKMSHTYDEEYFKEIVGFISGKFFPLFEKLYHTLKTQGAF